MSLHVKKLREPPMQCSGVRAWWKNSKPKNHAGPVHQMALSTDLDGSSWLKMVKARGSYKWPEPLAKSQSHYGPTRPDSLGERHNHAPVPKQSNWQLSRHSNQPNTQDHHQIRNKPNQPKPWICCHPQCLWLWVSKPIPPPLPK